MAVKYPIAPVSTIPTVLPAAILIGFIPETHEEGPLELAPLTVTPAWCRDHPLAELTERGELPFIGPCLIHISVELVPVFHQFEILVILIAELATTSKETAPVSYTHLTLPTKRIV